MIIAQTAPDANLLVQLYKSIDFVGLFLALGLVGLAYLSNRIVGGLLDRFAERVPRYRLPAKRLQSFVRLGLFLTAVVAVVLLLSRDNQPLLYGLGGTLLVAAGLGLKGTVSSLFAGVVLLVDQPFQVGDQVQYKDVYGEVLAIGLRSVRIWTREDEEVTIPNHRFLEDAVASASAGSLDMMVEMEFHVAAAEDHELARDLVYEACTASRFTHLDRRVEVFLREEDRGVGLSTIVTCRAYVFDARNDGSYKTDLTERVRRAFREHGLQRPYQILHEVRPPNSDTLPTRN